MSSARDPPREVERRRCFPIRLKYPRTPYWPYSPGIGRADTVHPDPERFVGRPDRRDRKARWKQRPGPSGKGLRTFRRRTRRPTSGWQWSRSTTRGRSPSRTSTSTARTSTAYTASQYGAVREEETFHAFALRDGRGDFSSMAALERFAAERSIPVVPVVYRGVFASIAEMREFIQGEHAKPSALGGEREGVVVRAADGFASAEFARSVCKSDASARSCADGPALDAKRGGFCQAALATDSMVDQQVHPRREAIGRSLDNSMNESLHSVTLFLSQDLRLPLTSRSGTGERTRPRDRRSPCPE